MQDKYSVQEVVVVLVLQVVNIKGMGFAVQTTINNSFVLAAVDRLVPLVVNTKGMVSAEATKC